MSQGEFSVVQFFADETYECVLRFVDGETAAEQHLPNCEICGEPMPPGEEMFKYHGYSGPCPKPALPKEETVTIILSKGDYDVLVHAINSAPDPSPALVALMRGCSKTS